MMRALLPLLFLLMSFELQAESKEIYVVVSGQYVPNDVDLYSKRGRKKVLHVVCYPIRYKDNLYNEELIEKTFKDFLEKKEKGTEISGIEVNSFEDRKEATDFYKDLTKPGQKNEFDRIPFTRAHLDRAQRELLVEMRALEKEKEKEEKDLPVKPQDNPPIISKPAVIKAIDDIYD